jgi:hypothetical protein
MLPYRKGFQLAGEVRQLLMENAIGVYRSLLDFFEFDEEFGSLVKDGEASI